MLFRKPLFAALAAVLAAVPAHAAPDAVTLTGEVKVIREVSENGAVRQVLESPEKVLPGDKLVFATRYRNAGTAPATDFVVTNPLPTPVRLARADGLEVSVDGGKSFGPLAGLTVAGAGGARRAAVLDDVTHVRWRIAAIAPGASGEVKYFGEVR